jgi:hypothetical protein
MKHIIIAPKNDANLDFLVKLAKGLKLKAKVLEGDEAEDFALGYAIQEGKKTRLISKAKVLKALNG